MNGFAAPTGIAGRPSASQPHRASASSVQEGARRKLRLSVLAWAFTLTNSLRVVAYLPTLLALHHSGNADQHSLWTWCTFCGANFTMAAWLYENNGQRIDRAVVVNLCNAAMCAAVALMILGCRWQPL